MRVIEVPERLERRTGRCVRRRVDVHRDRAVLRAAGHRAGASPVAVAVGPLRARFGFVLRVRREHERPLDERRLPRLDLLAEHTGPVVLRGRQHDVRRAVRVRVHLGEQPECELRRERLREVLRAGHVAADRVAQRLERAEELAVPEVVLVERLDRHRDFLPHRLRAPLPPERDVVGIVEVVAVRCDDVGVYRCRRVERDVHVLLVDRRLLARRDRPDDGREREVLRPGEQGRARVGTLVVRQRRVVEQQLRQGEGVLVGRDALVLHVRPAVRDAERPALQVRGDVEEEHVEHHPGPIRKILVGREFDQ